MCGGPEVPFKPDSKDLIAIIHPVPALSRRSSTESVSSTTSVSTQSTTTSTTSLSGRLLLSNQSPGHTTSVFSYDGEGSLETYELLNVRIHRYGSSSLVGRLSEGEGEDGAGGGCGGNPVMHSFFIGGFGATSLSSLISSCTTTATRFDLGVGGDGIVGRMVSILDADQRVLGEGVIGRI